ncbi:hypothetical protein TNCT_606001 [Trichonephila clavata]|uniref:Uncharacterized protein n=1 Tax=Trichonephila clavata TaxID=2740835 RepID=A0A8X6J0B2_TRICU|nr:hypothetical protein TNCT_606001 [Trichonephila clavata]
MFTSRIDDKQRLNDLSNQVSDMVKSQKNETVCRNSAFSQNREASFHGQVILNGRKFNSLAVLHADECGIPSCTASFRLLFIGLLYKAVSTSAAFVFTMNTLPDRFMSATDPLSRRCFTKRVIIDAFGVVSPGYFYCNAFIIRQ